MVLQEEAKLSFQSKMIFYRSTILMPFVAMLVMWIDLPLCQSAPFPSEKVIRSGRTIQDLCK